MIKLHFPSENKEENPLLTRGQILHDKIAFSFGKQGGKSSAHQRANFT